MFLLQMRVSRSVGVMSTSGRRGSFESGGTDVLRCPGDDSISAAAAAATGSQRYSAGTNVQRMGSTPRSVRVGDRTGFCSMLYVSAMIYDICIVI